MVESEGQEVEQEIKCVTWHTPGGWMLFAVGYERNGRIITRIENTSKEYLNHIEYCYRAYGEQGEVICELINCPVCVDYK